MPYHYVLSSFEPEKIGGTTLSMSDYSVLLNVAPMVLASVYEGGPESPCTGAAQDALISLRGFAHTLFYRTSQR